MAEKIIHEVRFFETDDGFRVEVKGDKERMGELGFGSGFPFGPHGHGRGGKGWGFRKGFFRGFGFGPCWHGKPETGEEPSAKA